jgi:hypothetical protein
MSNGNLIASMVIVARSSRFMLGRLEFGDIILDLKGVGKG